MIKANKNLKRWSVRGTGLIFGVIIFITLKSEISINPLYYIHTIYDKVGITIIALLPLALWAIYTAFITKHGSEWTLAYIGVTAQRVGLLGTVIGIVAATITIGDSLNNGAATAVTSALPSVGQALVSTAVGFVIAIVCDFFIYLNAKNKN